MKTVVFAMMILVCFSYILKQTYRKSYMPYISAVVCALFIGFSWRYAIEQSKTQISDWLANTSLMLDIAVILTIEVAIQMSFCILAAHIHTSESVEKRTKYLYRFLEWFPGVLIFPVLFSILVSIIFALPGVSFSRIAWIMAAALIVIIPLTTWVMKKILPEKEIRLELLFLVNALIAIMGIIATVNGQTAVAGISEIDWNALLGVLAFVASGFLGGICLHKIKMKKNQKNN